MAAINAQNADYSERQNIRNGEEMKFLVRHGVHPMIARCAILNDPRSTCATVLADLDSKERMTITDLLSRPSPEMASPVDEDDEAPVSLPTNPLDYVKGLDFGLTSPTQ
jgi:hypothetical protein